jgi:hypothetical protein
MKPVEMILSGEGRRKDNDGRGEAVNLTRYIVSIHRNITMKPLCTTNIH